MPLYYPAPSAPRIYKGRAPINYIPIRDDEDNVRYHLTALVKLFTAPAERKRFPGLRAGLIQQAIRNGTLYASDSFEARGYFTVPEFQLFLSAAKQWAAKAGRLECWSGRRLASFVDPASETLLDEARYYFARTFHQRPEAIAQSLAPEHYCVLARDTYYSKEQGSRVLKHFADLRAQVKAGHLVAESSQDPLAGFARTHRHKHLARMPDGGRLWERAPLERAQAQHLALVAQRRGAGRPRKPAVRHDPRALLEYYDTQLTRLATIVARPSRTQRQRELAGRAAQAMLKYQARREALVARLTPAPPCPIVESSSSPKKD